MNILGENTKNILYILLFASIFFVFRINVINGDSLLAWPITESLVRPDFYHGKDLVVSAGKESPFLLYKFLAKIPFYQENYPLRDFLLYFPIFFLYLYFWFLIFFALSKERTLALFTLFIFLISDSKLGLNWSQSPMRMFVSLSSIHWLQVGSLLFFLKNKYTVSMILLGLSSYLHPGSGISYFLVFASYLIYESFKRKDLKISFYIIPFLIVFSPNFFMLQQSTSKLNIFSPDYFKFFEIFQYHAYLGDHFKEGYSYAIALILIIYSYWKNKEEKPGAYKKIFVLFVISFLWSFIWFLNLYFFKNLTFIHTFFVTRIFYFLKPLIIFFFILTVPKLVEKDNCKTCLLYASLVILTLVSFSPFVSLIIILSYLIYLRKKWWGTITFFILLLSFILISKFFEIIDPKLILKNYSHNSLIPFEIIVLVGIVLILKTSLFPEKKLDSVNKERNATLFYKITCILAILVFLISSSPRKRFRSLIKLEKPISLSWNDYFNERKKYPDYSELLDWSKTVKGKMFIVPPDKIEFMSFRYFTKNSIYITEFEINQLMYSPKYYLDGINRLKTLGLKVKGRHNTSYEDYQKISIDDLRKTGANYVIFEKNSSFIKRDYKPVFENKKYVVYELG